MDNQSQHDDSFRARWVRISADMLEHDAFAGEPYSKHAAWLWLIANAAWKPRRFKAPNVNAMVELERGQVLAARHYLADKWQWSEKKVRNFLAFLLSQNMIEMGQSKGRFANVVTVCNYDKYQTANSEKGQLNGQFGASSGPVEGQTLTRDTTITNSRCESARDGEVAHAHGVFVNCETIRHASFTISLPSIELATIASGLPQAEIKQVCLAHAMQWAAEIEGGKLSRDVVPSKIANFLASTIMRDKARAVAPAQPGASASRAPLSAGASWHEKQRRNGEIILALARGENVANG